jgi:hypothetical protein
LAWLNCSSLENSLTRHGQRNILGVLRLVLGRKLPQASLRMTEDKSFG